MDATPLASRPRSAGRAQDVSAGPGRDSSTPGGVVTASSTDSCEAERARTDIRTTTVDTVDVDE